MPIRKCPRRSSTCSRRGPGRRRSASSGSSAAHGGRGRLHLHARAGTRRTRIDNVNLTYNRRPARTFRTRIAPRCRIPQYGIISMIPHNTRSELSRAADQLHQADEPPLAGVGAPTRCRGSRTRRTSRSAGSTIVPFTVRRDLGNEFTLRRYRPAPPRRVQRHLGGRPRLPGERTALLRRRHPQRRPTTAATCAVSAPAAARGCVRTARSSRATTSSSRRRTGPTCACSSGFRSAAARRSTSSPRRSTCSTGRTGAITTQESSANFGQRTSAQYRDGAARFPVDVLGLAGLIGRSYVQRGPGGT